MAREQQIRRKPESDAETQAAIAEVVDISIAREKKRIQDFLLRMVQELNDVETRVGTKGSERKDAKFQLQFILKELKFERDRMWENESVSPEMIQELNTLLGRAKQTESLLTSPTEKAFKIAGKTLSVLALGMGFKLAMDKYDSFETIKEMVADAQASMAEYQAPEVPEGMFVMGEETAHTYDTSGLFDNFTEQSKRLFEHGIPLITDDPSKDFEKAFIAYAPQLTRGPVPNFEDAYLPHLAEATHRTPEQMKFVASVANDALFAKPFSFGGGISGAVYEGQRAYDSDVRKKTLEIQYGQGLAFLDRVFNERLKDLAPEIRNEVKDEIAAYLRAEVRVRLDMATVNDYVARNDVDGLTGREATSMVPGREAAPVSLEENLKEREQALGDLHKELVRVKVARPAEGTRAQALVDWRTHAPIYGQVADYLGQEMDRGVFMADGSLFADLLQQMKNRIELSRDVYVAASRVGDS